MFKRKATNKRELRVVLMPSRDSLLVLKIKRLKESSGIVDLR